MKQFIYEFFYKINIISITFIYLFLYLYITELPLLFFNNSEIDNNFFFKINNFETQWIVLNNSYIFNINHDIETEFTNVILINDGSIFFIIITIYYTFLIIYPLFIYEFYILMSTSFYIHEKQIFTYIILLYYFQYFFFMILKIENFIYNNLDYEQESFFYIYIYKYINSLNFILFQIIIKFILFNIYMYFFFFKYNYKFLIITMIIYILLFNYEFIILLCIQIILWILIRFIKIYFFYYKSHFIKKKLVNNNIN